MARILVVEDNAYIAKMVSFILISEGYEVSVVHDGIDVVDAVRAFRPDLVVSDIALPHEDGISLAKKIDEEFGIPVIIMTAFSGMRHRLAALRAGAIDFIAKPFEPGDLVVRIKDALERARASC